MGPGKVETLSKPKLNGRQLKEYRSALAKLKSRGLVSKRIDARSHKPTRYMIGQLKKFEDVLKDRAAVVKVPRDERSKYTKSFAEKFGRLVVPKEHGEHVEYNKRLKQIRGVKRRNGRIIRKIKVAWNPMISNLSDLPKGENVLYSIPFGTGSFTTFDLQKIAELIGGLGYSEKRTNEYLKYLELLETEYDEDGEDLESDAAYFGTGENRNTRTAKGKRGSANTKAKKKRRTRKKI